MERRSTIRFWMLWSTVFAMPSPSLFLHFMLSRTNHRDNTTWFPAAHWTFPRAITKLNWNQKAPLLGRRIWTPLAWKKVKSMPLIPKCSVNVGSHMKWKDMYILMSLSFYNFSRNMYIYTHMLYTYVLYIYTLFYIYILYIYLTNNSSLV